MIGLHEDGNVRRAHGVACGRNKGCHEAYGAGLLNGWTRTGKCHELSIVTGVSTGALIARFVFLKAEEDATLKRLHTTISAKGIYRVRFELVVPASPGVASTELPEKLIVT